MTALQATGQWGVPDALVLALARCALTAALLRRRRHRARLQLPSRACARRLAGTEGAPCNLQSSVQALSAHALLPRSANACPAPQASADVTARAAVQPRTRPGARPETCRGRVTQQKTHLFARCSNQYGPQSHCDEGAQSVLAATQTRVNRTGRGGAGIDTRRASGPGAAVVSLPPSRAAPGLGCGSRLHFDFGVRGGSSSWRSEITSKRPPSYGKAARMPYKPSQAVTLTSCTAFWSST